MGSVGAREFHRLIGATFARARPFLALLFVNLVVIPQSVFADAIMLTGGIYTVQAGVPLQMGGVGVSSVQALTGNASLTVKGPGILEVDGATNVLAALTSITDSQVNVNGVSNLTITPVATPATLKLAADAAGTSAGLTLSGSGVTVSGGLTNSTSDTALYGATLGVQNGSTLTTGAFLNQATATHSSQDSISIVNITGGSTLDADSLTTFTNNGFAFSNINIVDSSLNVTHAVVQGGGANNTLYLTSSAATIGGTFRNSGAVTLSNNSALTSAGLFDNSSGTLTLNGGGNTLAAAGFTNTSGTLNVLAGDIADFRGGQFSNLTSGTLASGTYLVGGTLRFDSGNGVINQIGSGVSLTLDGQNGGAAQVLSGTDNALGNLTGNAGSFTLANGVNFTSPGDFTNSGMVSLEGTGNQLAIAGTFFDNGTLTIASGNTFTAGAVALGQGGTLSGGGTINGNLINDGGTISPGDPQTLCVTGFFDEGNTGAINLDLASAGLFDQIIVAGNATLGGTLDLTLEPGFDAPVGQIFQIMTWSSAETAAEAGDFSVFNNQTFDGGTRAFQETFFYGASSNGLELEVVAVAPPAPEPSTVAMMVCALTMGVGVVWKRRR